MKAVNIALALLTAITLALSPVGPIGAAEAGAIHTGKGTLLSVDLQGGRLLMTEEPSGSHLLSLNHQTKIVDEMGSPISPAALQPGDLVREECFFLENGKGLATQIRRLRPAWMETASPEQ